MATYTHDPSLLAVPNGTVLGNGASTGAAAGWVLTGSLSGDAAITWTNGAWVCTGTTGLSRLNGLVTAASILGVELLLDLGAAPAAQDRILELRHASNYAIRLNHETDGTLGVLNAAGAGVFSSSGSYTGLTRIFLAIQPGTGAGDGKIRLYIYSGLSATPAETPWAPDNQNVGTAQIVEARMGHLSAVSDTVSVVNAVAVDSLTPPGVLVPTPTNVAWNGSRLSWAAAPGAATYDVEKDASVVETAIAGTQWTDLGAAAGVGHTYRVRAVV